MPILGPFFTKLGRNEGKSLLSYNDPLSPSSASNYIITGSTGFETAKACAIIEDSRIEENLLLDENRVSTKSGESLGWLLWLCLVSHRDFAIVWWCFQIFAAILRSLFLGRKYENTSFLRSCMLNDLANLNDWIARRVVVLTSVMMMMVYDLE